MWDPEWAKAHCMKKWVILYDSYIMRYSKTVYVYCYLVKMDGNPQNLENSWIHTRCNGSNGVIPCHERSRTSPRTRLQYFYSTFYNCTLWFDLTYFGIWLSDFIWSLYLGMQSEFCEFIEMNMLSLDYGQSIPTYIYPKRRKS